MPTGATQAADVAQATVGAQANGRAQQYMLGQVVEVKNGSTKFWWPAEVRNVLKLPNVFAVPASFDLEHMSDAVF